MMKILKWLLGCVVAIVLVLIAWLAVSPPELIRVAAKYSAKIVCSNVFLANRDANEVLKIDVQAPGHPILTVMNVDVNREKGTVEAGLFGLFGNGLAVHRPGFGCTTVPDGNVAALPELPSLIAVSNDPSIDWPLGDGVLEATDQKFDEIFNDETLAGPGMRAIVIVKDGKIIAERYADGFSPTTPFLGWSMAKTVTASLVGRMIEMGNLDLAQNNLFDAWADDNRRQIKLSDLMGMAGDLEWNEGYGTVSDVTRLLYLDPDMAKAIISKPLATLDGSNVGKKFNYSSGTTVAIARHMQDRFEDNLAALAFPHDELFTRLGMTSAIMETDSRGNLVGGSYVYATARDWARFGQFLLQKGNWNGEQLLPNGYVDWMTKPHPATEDGRYGQGQIWLRPPGAGREGDNPQFDHRAFWLGGHDGQSIAIMPDENLVIVRLGLTPSKLLYKPAKLANAVVAATQ